MTQKTLSELNSPDERSLRFSGLGFSPNLLLKPEVAAAHIQRTVGVELDPAVPQTIRDSYDRVRSTHIYGLFDYSLFTAAGDLALLSLQQAFAERFIDYYNGVIPLVNQSGTERPISGESYEAVHAAFFEKGSSHQRGDWYVKSLVNPGGKSQFRGALSHFFAWARMERLLDGQRSKVFDRVLVRMRNRAAHPVSYKLSMPPDSALTIRDVAEFINRLWGARTPGGRIFPQPIGREAVVLGWARDGNSFIQGRPDQLIEDPSRRDWTYVVVQAVPGDELVAFDADLETLRYSARWLWGPGSYDSAVEWLNSARLEADEVDHIDRWFVVRGDHGKIDPPRNPNQFAGLPTDRRNGEWALIRADYPLDAFNHVRSSLMGDPGCATLGACERCSVEIDMRGDWEGVCERLDERNVRLQPQVPIGVRTGYLHGHWEVWSAV